MYVLLYRGKNLGIFLVRGLQEQKVEGVGSYIRSAVSGISVAAWVKIFCRSHDPRVAWHVSLVANPHSSFS